MTTKFEEQLSHPFYDSVDTFRNEVKVETLQKASIKYDEPFNPSSWTNEQLAKHAMFENFDQSVYITGMRDRMIEQEATIKELRAQIQKLLTRSSC